MAGIVFSADGRRSRGITGTFSVVARCSRTSSLGVCVSTAVPAVGSVVPHVEPQVGAVATQGYTRVIYGNSGGDCTLLRRWPKH